MFVISAKRCYILLLLYLFSAIQNSSANPYGHQQYNNYKCIRLNEPPYFYCNLPSENIKRNDEITVRNAAENNEKEYYPIYPTTLPSTTTPTATETLPIFVPNKNMEVPERNFAKETSSKFENDNFSMTEKSYIFTTTTSSSSITTTSGLIEETLLTESTENHATTTTPVAPKKSNDDSSFIISELSQPLPSNRGPTIMEELFIDTLTKSQQQQEENEAAASSSSSSFDAFHNELLIYSNRQLRSLCRRFLPFARRHCHREWTHPNFVDKCRGYFDDCQRFILRADPLEDVSRAFQMNVRYGNPGFPFRNVPQYY